MSGTLQVTSMTLNLASVLSMTPPLSSESKTWTTKLPWKLEYMPTKAHPCSLLSMEGQSASPASASKHWEATWNIVNSLTPSGTGRQSPISLSKTRSSIKYSKKTSPYLLWKFAPSYSRILSLQNACRSASSPIRTLRLRLNSIPKKHHPHVIPSPLS